MIYADSTHTKTKVQHYLQTASLKFTHICIPNMRATQWFIPMCPKHFLVSCDKLILLHTNSCKYALYLILFYIYCGTKPQKTANILFIVMSVISFLLTMPDLAGEQRPQRTNRVAKKGEFQRAPARNLIQHNSINYS